MGKTLFNAFSSLKLTVACLVLGCVLVFWTMVIYVMALILALCSWVNMSETLRRSVA